MNPKYAVLEDEVEECHARNRVGSGRFEAGSPPALPVYVCGRPKQPTIKDTLDQLKEALGVRQR